MRPVCYLLFIAVLTLPSCADDKSLQQFAKEAVQAQANGNTQALAAMFASGKAPAWTKAGGLKSWSADIMPAAPGYGDAAAWLVIWHTQTPEADGDRVYPIVKTGGKWVLGDEVPEDVVVPFTVDEHKLDMRIVPDTQQVNISDEFQVKGEGKSLVMRLSPAYRLINVRIGEKDAALLQDLEDAVNPQIPAGPVVVRCGSLLWMRGELSNARVTMKYAGQVREGGERAGPDAAFLTAYWWPSIGRRPVKHQVTIHVPPDWIAIGQGKMVSEAKSEREYAVTWRNDLAVSFLTVTAGPFVMGAETSDRGRVFRSYMMPGAVDKTRAEKIVDDCKRAVAFYEDRLGKFPFDHYYVVDSPQYYGLEAYSFTVLTPNITSWAPTHEIAHTYFGGIVPCSYLHSIWNESMAQYLDSILFKQAGDNTMAMGYGSRYGDALSSINGLSNRSQLEGYMRGAYTLKMLQEEMGLDAMIRCMKRFCEDRRGMVSDWPDFQAAVRKETGGKYDWFFDQWIYSGAIPTLEITSVEKVSDGDLRVAVRQSLEKPYRLTFEIQAGDVIKRVAMTKSSEDFVVHAPGADKVRLVTKGITLARSDKDVPVGR